MVIKHPECRYNFLELQVCSKWTSKFPYPRVYVFARKYKYGLDTLFITFNCDLTKGYIFDANSFKNVTPRRVKKYSREFVYDIPWKNIMSFDSENLDIDTILSY